MNRTVTDRAYPRSLMLAAECLALQLEEDEEQPAGESLEPTARAPKLPKKFAFLQGGGGDVDVEVRVETRWGSFVDNTPLVSSFAAIKARVLMAEAALLQTSSQRSGPRASSWPASSSSRCSRTS